MNAVFSRVNGSAGEREVLHEVESRGQLEESSKKGPEATYEKVKSKVKSGL